MKLRMRLIVSYTILALVAAVVLGSISYYYIEQQYRSSAVNNAETTARRVLETYDMTQNIMEQTAQFILSSPDALASIRELSKLMKDPQANAADIASCRNDVKRVVDTAYNLDNFYRVLVFNQYGYIAASAQQGERLTDVSVDPMEIPWMEQVVGSKGRSVLVGLHGDDWGVRSKGQMVYSIAKEIQGDNLGYIEVQITADQFINPLKIQEGKIIAVGPDGNLLYQAGGLSFHDYERFLTTDENGVFEAVGSSGKKEIVVTATSEFSGVRLLLIQEWDSVNALMMESEWITVMVCGVFLAFSVVFIIITSSLLTKPIRQLRKKMEGTELSNMDHDIAIKSKDADIQALTGAYQELMRRLQEAMLKEKRLTLLQLQAQFDALQAQINPHFLYNVLNIISNRGMQDEDETICDICASLAAMLRYAANTVERYASIAQEMEYLESYLYLLQARFESRLQVYLEMDESIYQEMVPKITVQQLVENSIKHGCRNSPGKMEIRIRGYRTAGGWRVEVTDNGEGIREEVRERLQLKMQELRARLSDGKEVLEMEIGGMGLINTYGRLYLLYQERTVFDVRKRTDGPGTISVVGVETEEG